MEYILGVDSWFNDEKSSLSSEVWMPVKGFEGCYEVSSHGNIKSLDRFVKGCSGFPRQIKSTHIKPSLTQGYLYVGLARDGYTKSKSIHRIVAEAFIPNPDNLETVNHIDGNKLNNNVDNLEWCTKGDNTRHRFAIGIGNKRRKGVGKLAPHINEIRDMLAKNMKYVDIAAKFNVRPKAISKIDKGITY